VARTTKKKVLLGTQKLTKEEFALKPVEEKKQEVEEKEKVGKSQWIKENEFTLYGWNACMAAFKNRPDDLRRVFFDPKLSPKMGAVKKYCHEKKLPYKKIEAEELNRVAASVHHEGVVMVMKPTKQLSAHSLIRRKWGEKSIVAVLDRVSNSHNLGAILRTCAYFGVEGLLISEGDGQATMSSSTARMAEGALETTPLYSASDLPSALRDIQEQGVFVLGTDVSAKHSLYEIKLPLPCAVVFGNEGEGLSDRVKKRCNQLVRIPAYASVESLNVGVSAGIVLSELRRRTGYIEKKK
jgi:RNA methyltransferase, TrmH family